MTVSEPRKLGHMENEEYPYGRALYCRDIETLNEEISKVLTTEAAVRCGIRFTLLEDLPESGPGQAVEVLPRIFVRKIKLLSIAP